MKKTDGRKLSSHHKTSIPKVNGYTLKTTTDLYVDGLMLRGDTPLLWQFDGGYVELDANGTPTSWNYYITDHLGSTRMVVSNDSIKETINYYPFGSEMKMENPALLTGGISHPFRFTGKELDRLSALNMYDFGARWYDVAGVPMWTSMDPLCEKYYIVSPYVYCENNPISVIDPTGMQPDSLEAALMAAYSYRDKNSRKYAKQLNAFQWNVSNNIESISGMKATIFTRTTHINGDLKTEYAIAFAGTDFNFGSVEEIAEAIKDVGTDIQHFWGLGISLQQIEAVKYAFRLSSTANDVTFVGHSLGGGLAAFSSMLTGVPAITFNSASINGGPKIIGNIMYGDNNIIQYQTVGKSLGGVIRIGGDPVNYFQRNIFRPSQGKVHPVYINSFLPNHKIETFVTKFGGY